jgi:hypothetical protein
MSDAPKIPKELDAIVDKVLAFRPKPKTDAGKARKRKAGKIKRAKKPVAEQILPEGA